MKDDIGTIPVTLANQAFEPDLRAIPGNKGDPGAIRTPTKAVEHPRLKGPYLGAEPRLRAHPLGNDALWPGQPGGTKSLTTLISPFESHGKPFF